MSSQQNQFVDGNNEEYVFNEESKKGWCYLCNVDLSSKQTAEDHLRSKGHGKKKQMKGKFPTQSQVSLAGAAALPLRNPEVTPPSSGLPRNIINDEDSASENRNECPAKDATFNTITNIQPVSKNASDSSQQDVDIAAESAVSHGQSIDVLNNTGKEYDFNEITNKGWCYVCDVNLSSKQTAEDHFRSKGHEKKKCSRATLPSIPQKVGDDTPSSKLEADDLSSAKVRPVEAVASSVLNTGPDDSNHAPFVSASHGFNEHLSALNPTSSDSDSAQQQSNNTDDDGQDYTYNQESGQGMCNICMVTLSSKIQADDHLRSKQHEKKKKMKKALPNCGLMSQSILPPAIVESFPSCDENTPSSVMNKQCETEDSTSSYYIRPDDLLSTNTFNAQHGLPEVQQLGPGCDFLVPASASLNDLNRSICALKPNDNNEIPHQNLLPEAYVFDKKTKKGQCFLCDVDLTSEQQADDHLRSRGHEKKKKLQETSLLNHDHTAPVLQSAAAKTRAFQAIEKDFQGLRKSNEVAQASDNMQNCFDRSMQKKELFGKELFPNDFNRQYNVDRYHTNKQNIFESGKNVTANDPEQTRRKEYLLHSDSNSATPSLDVLDSGHETQVKTPCGIPTASVLPDLATAAASTNTTPQTGNTTHGESHPRATVPSTPPQSMKEADEIYCDVCNVECTSREMYEQHRNGKQHLSKLRRSQRVQPRNEGSGKVTVSLTLNLEVDK